VSGVSGEVVVGIMAELGILSIPCCTPKRPGKNIRVIRGKVVSGHFKQASNGRNDPATLICVSRHFSSNQTRRNSLVSGLFERKMPLFSSHLMQDSLAGSFRPSVAGLISTDDSKVAAC